MSLSRDRRVRPAWTLFRFFLASGVRLGLRAGIPLAAAGVVAVGAGPDPGATLEFLALDLADGRARFATAAVLAALAVAVAAWSAPRLGYGIGGWIRHLPFRGTHLRRAVLAALVVTQAPFALAWGGLYAHGAARVAEPRLSQIVALPLVLAGTALLTLPGVRRRWTIPCGAIAIAGALSATWSAIAVGVTAFVTGEFAAGSPRASTRGRKRRRDPGLETPGSRLASFFRFDRTRRWPEAAIAFRVAFRAVGARALSILALGALPLAAVALFLENNPHVATGLPVRFGTLVASTIVLAGLAETLSVRRPSWPWARTLPVGSERRVRADAVWLALHATPWIAASAWLDVRQTAVVAAPALYLAIRAADAMRRARTHAGAWGPIAVEGTLVAAWCGVSPWCALVPLALALPAYRAAVRRDRDLAIARWNPEHHLAAGDPGSFRGGA